MKQSVTIEEVIKLLNEMIRLDPDATYKLFRRMKEYCNEDLANHADIMVDGHSEPGRYKVGLLGILNGLFGRNTKGFGAIYMDIDTDRSTIKRFWVDKSAVKGVRVEETQHKSVDQKKEGEPGRGQKT